MQKVFREIKRQIIFDNRNNLNFPAHIHEDIELVFIKKGKGTAYCDGKKYTLSENTFFLSFPNQVHHYSDCVPGEYYTLIIKPTALLGYTRVFEECTPISALWSAADDDGTAELLKMALKEYELDGDSIIIRSYLTAFMGKLLKNYEIKKSKVSHDTVSRILLYCTNHYKENITIEEVAKNTHMSRSSVSHIFSYRLNMNFCDYINSLRLNDAVYMLKNENYSITEIADLSGFSTIRTFNRAFLKRYGVSPSCYKKQM